MDALYHTLNEWLGLSLSPQDLSVPQMTLRAVVIALAALVMLRMAHKRFFAQRNAMDVLLAFVLASTLSRAINGSAAFFPTIATGFVLVFLHRVLTRFAARSSRIGWLLKGAPAAILENGQLKMDALRQHDLSKGDVIEDLRIKGVDEPARVRTAFLERNGEVSVLRAPRVQTISVEAGVQTVRLEVW